MPLIQIDLKTLYINVVVSDVAQLSTSSNSLADQTAQKDYVKILPGFTYLGLLMVLMTEDALAQRMIPLPSNYMCVLYMTSGKMYALVMYNS